MPREVVYGLSLPYGTTEEPGPARAVAEVSWHPGSHVQLVTQCVRSVDGSVYEAKAGEPGADEDLAGQEIPRTSGFYLDLDRKGINDLIRYLRRARDQAFGKDE